MSSLVKFTPLCGAKSEQPLCYLLEIDEACILLDCGWDESFDVRLLRQLAKVAPKIDAVLLTHCDLAHLGALPYIFSKGNMKAKIYATLPVQKMGQLTMYDIVLSRQAKEDFDLFSLADVDTAWDNFVQLRYQQSVSLSGKAEGITVSPLNAGHMIGGALWKITKDSEEIVYAVDYNHAQDRHLDGTVLVDLPRPNILITDAYTALDPPMTGGRKAREGRLLEQITAALQRGGNVLLPSDSTGRVLELMILLDEYWTQNNMRNVTLAFFSPEGRSTLDMAASQTEWLSKHVNQRFVQSRRNVFHFEHLRRCCSRQELASLPFPQVVLASGLDLETSSFSLDLFAEWAGDPRNAVVLTHKARPGCFARRLIDGCLAGTPPPREPVVLQMHRRVQLEGRELWEHEEQQRAKQEEARRKQQEEEEEEAEAAAEERAERAAEEAAAAASAEPGAAPAAPVAAPGSGVKRKRPRAEGRFLMFPHFEEAIMFDEYGEVMDTSVYQKQQDEVLGFTDETINFSGLDTRTVAPQGEREGAVVPAQPREEVPTKSVAYTVRVQMQAAVSFVDFGGRSDGRSAHTILEHLKPGKVIIVHGTEAATESLRDFCVAKVTEPESTMAPAVGDAVLASSDTNIYRIKLDSDLAQSLAFVRVGGYDVAYIDAVMQMPAQPTQPAAAQAAQVPTLVQRPGDAGRGRPFAFIGDVKLSDLKTLLSKEGYRTELKAGMLVVNGQVVIRKSGARMVFEGTICNEYAAVRNILLSQYHTL